MAEMFIGLVKKMVIFLVAGQTILHFGMGKQYERYVKLIISLMMVAQFLSAGFGFFSPAMEREFLAGEERLISSFQERWRVNLEEFEERLYRKQEEFEEGRGKLDLPQEGGILQEAESFSGDGSSQGAESTRKPVSPPNPPMEPKKIRIEEIKIQ